MEPHRPPPPGFSAARAHFGARLTRRMSLKTVPGPLNGRIALAFSASLALDISARAAPATSMG